MSELTLPKGTIVKVNGLPFELKEDTAILGVVKNLEVAVEETQDEPKEAAA